jgi:cytochrome o ubiquinol oxidase subunit 1
MFQLAYSIWNRKKYVDKTGDPWNGRTLEWSTASPAPHYNFAVIPQVDSRDPFWEYKHKKQKPDAPKYQSFEMPRNSSMGMVIAVFSATLGFALIWHIWWLAAIGLLGVLTAIIIRINDDNTEYTVTVEEIKRIEGMS